MIKFKVANGFYGNINLAIVEVMVVKETAKMVTLENGVREAKSSSYNEYFDTFKEAYDYKLASYDHRIKMLHKQHMNIVDQLSDFKNEYEDKLKEST